MALKIKKLTQDAIIPSRNSEGDAGLDLFSTENYTLKPLERKLFKTNIALAIPSGYYGRIADRSGNAYKKGLHVMGGVIDETYRGDVGVILFNTSDTEVSITKADRIAQIIIEQYFNFEIEEVEDLEETVRGDKGFGSSGN